MINLNNEQKKAVLHKDGPCLVLGTPGSGKTTVIVNRIKNLIEKYNVNPAEILVITFTRAAALSMQERFLKMMGGNNCRVRFGTFHSFFFWIIKTAYHMDSSAVISEDEKRNIIRKIIMSFNMEYENSEDIITSAIRQIGIVNCDMIDIEAYYSKDMPEAMFRELYKRYEAEKKRIKKLDFDDMLNMCHELLKERQDILSHIRRLYKYILVDEFQDTNRIQYEILKMIVHPADNLFAVGDDDQSIYGFRGARPDIMLGFTDEFKGAEIITLGINYRCPDIITQASSRLIKKNKKRFDKVLTSDKRNSGEIIVEFPKDVKNENEMIVSRIKEAHVSGVPYEEIAVLYRTNLNPRRLIYKLREYNIPFFINDTIPNIFEHFTVEAILAYIRFSLGENERRLFLKFMNKPVRYISRAMLTEETVELSELLNKTAGKEYLRVNVKILKNQLETIRRLNPYAAVNYIRKAVGYDDYIEEYADKRNIDSDELFDIMDEFQSMVKDFSNYEDMFSFIDDYTALLKEKAGRINNDKKNAVNLMTMHGAKGLEFTEVHILDCVESMMPYKKSKTPAEIEEERRMFYVAVTRAKYSLYLYAPKLFGKKEGVPSRFIFDMREKKD